MKRPVSLAGAIVSTVASGVFLVMSVITLVGAMMAIAAIAGAMSEIGSTGSGITVAYGILLAFISIVMLAFGISTFVLSVKMFKYVNGTHEEYVAKKRKTITLIVLNFIVALLCLYLAISSVSDEGGELNLVLYLIILLAFIACNVLLIIDLAKEKKRAESVPIARPAEEVKVEVKEEQVQEENAETEEEKKE